VDGTLPDGLLGLFLELVGAGEGVGIVVTEGKLVPKHLGGRDIVFLLFITFDDPIPPFPPVMPIPPVWPLIVPFP
jgi:hypothetical protein